MLLGNHSRIAAPPAPHLLATFSPIAGQAVSLDQAEHQRVLLEDMFRLVNHPYHDWDLHPDLDDLAAGLQGIGMMPCVDAVYRAYARRAGKPRYALKENNLFDFLGPIDSYYDSPRYIYLYRDCRDYAVSWMDAIGPVSTPYQAAMRWQSEQSRCLDAARMRGDQILKLSYESLVSDTEASMRGVLDFLGEPHEAACFSTGRSSKSSLPIWNPLWKNLSRPIMRENFQKYRQRFGDETIEMIETIARSELEALGYQLESPAAWVPPASFELQEQSRSFIKRIRNRRPRFARTRRLLVDRSRLIEEIRSKRKSLRVSGA